MIKIRLRFSKTGPLRFIGHLNFLKVFQQTIRRAGLPVAYSQGFNPHMQLSFALPLPLGMTSNSDYADLTLEREMPGEELVSRFNTQAPGGLHLIDAWETIGPGAAALVTVADYYFSMEMPESVNTDMIAIINKAEEIVQPLLNQKSIIIPKKTKSGINNTDIRPDIFGIYAGAGQYSQPDETGKSYIYSPCQASIRMFLAAGSGRFLNPLIVAKLILGHDIDTSSITRHELYHYTSNKPFDPLDKELIPLYETPIH